MSGISVWNHGMDRVANLMYRWNIAVAPLMLSNDTVADVQMVYDLDETQKLATLLSRLNLDPDFRTLAESMMNTSNLIANPRNVLTELWQYAGQTYMKSAQVSE